MVTDTVYPSVTKTAHNPALTEYGVELNYYRSPSDGDNVVVYGTFLMPKKHDIRSFGDPHKSLVLTVNSFGRHVVVTPFMDTIIFPDDLKENDQVRMGYFQFNISSYIDTSIVNDYYIVCSLGIYISNILMVTIK